MLMDAHATPAQVKRLAANIFSAAGRMRELLTDLMSVAHGSGPSAEICDIREVIGAPLVRSRMQSVFVNLIANSVEAMPTGGRVRITVRKAGNFLPVQFEDSGPGIPRQICDRLFEPFITAGKDKRVGIGAGILPPDGLRTRRRDLE